MVSSQRAAGMRYVIVAVGWSPAFASCEAPM